MATANVAHQPLGRRVESPDDPVVSRTKLGTPTLSSARSTSPPTFRPVAISEVWLIRGSAVIVELSHSDARRAEPRSPTCPRPPGVQALLRHHRAARGAPGRPRHAHGRASGGQRLQHLARPGRAPAPGSTSTSRSPRTTTPRSAPSTRQRSRRATRTTADPVSAPSTTRLLRGVRPGPRTGQRRGRQPQPGLSQSDDQRAAPVRGPVPVAPSRGRQLRRRCVAEDNAKISRLATAHPHRLPAVARRRATTRSSRRGGPEVEAQGIRWQADDEPPEMAEVSEEATAGSEVEGQASKFGGAQVDGSAGEAVVDGQLTCGGRLPWGPPIPRPATAERPFPVGRGMRSSPDAAPARALPRTTRRAPRDRHESRPARIQLAYGGSEVGGWISTIALTVLFLRLVSKVTQSALSGGETDAGPFDDTAAIDSENENGRGAGPERAAHMPRCGWANPATAKFYAECGARLESDSASVEIRKLVTLLFCDLVGSTPWASASTQRPFAGFSCATTRRASRRSIVIGARSRSSSATRYSASSASRPRTRTTHTEPVGRRSTWSRGSTS